MGRGDRAVGAPQQRADMAETFMICVRRNFDLMARHAQLRDHARIETVLEFHTG